MSFRPLEDRVIVRRHDAIEISKGGIIIPDTVQEKPQLGTIVHAGPGKTNRKGHLIPLTLKEGDEVLFGKWCDEEVEVAGEKLLLLREDDILGTMTE